MLQAAINKDSLTRRRLCDKLHGRQPQLLLTRPAVIDLFVQNRDLYLPHLLHHHHHHHLSLL